jgi:WD40 repeat protein
VAFAHSTRLTALEVLERNHHIVVHDPAGAVWDVSGSGAAKQVRVADGAEITLLRASPDGRLVAIGTGAGDVAVYETEGYTVTHRTTLPDSVRQIYFDPQNRDLLISSEAGHVRLLPLDSRRSLPWRDLSIGARDFAYSPDGDTIAIVCVNGSSWFYGAGDNTWVYARDHASLVMSGRFSRDGAMFATTDTDGNVVLRDVRKTFTTDRERRADRKPAHGSAQPRP